MNPPKLSLEAAWRILGKNASVILSEIKALPTRAARVEATTLALEKARKIARELSLKYHPDKNPSEDSAAKFRDVQNAVACITYHTEELLRKSNEIDARASSQRDGFIELKK